MFFKLPKTLPPFIKLARLRDDIVMSLRAEGLADAVFCSTEPPSVGALAAFEIEVDDTQLTWERADDRTNWLVLKGRMERVEDGLVRVAGVHVTTTPVPSELDREFIAIFQHDGSAVWELVALTPVS